jgi:transposase
MTAGIDIGSREHWVCAPPEKEGERNVRVFRTTTPQLETLAEWLIEQGVESAAMESTSVYWIPVYELLESHGIEVVLVNARQLHNVPGRKTDMADCQWLQLLHSCGLLRGSFRPTDAICKLRALQRQRGNLVAQRSRCVQWMQKALDQMNVQVHRAVSDVTGQTGMAIIRAIVNGERDPNSLAALRDHRCRKSVEEIAEYLTGNWRQEHLFNLESSLRLFDNLEQEIVTYETRLREELEHLQPPERRHQPVPAHPNPAKEKYIKRMGDQETRTALWRLTGVDLTRIDGIGATAAQTVITEVGFDLSAFPTEKNFVSWLRQCPRTPISGGKPLRKKTKGLGANRVASVLRMAAVSLQRSKTALGGFYRRMSRRKGAAVAVFATARKLATLVYRMLRYGQDYIDIGERAYEERFQQRRIAALQNAAESLGFQFVPREPDGVVSG